MAKILNTDDLLEAASADLPNFDAHCDAIVAAVAALAADLAKHYDIEVGETTWEGKDFAGLCAAFYPANPGQECPEMIEEGDEGGDWEPRFQLTVAK